MARKTRAKPSDPEAARLAKRRQDLEAVNLPIDAAELPRQADIDVTRAGEKRDGQKADHDGAERLDAFKALKAGMAPGAYDAAKRFELDVMTRRGENDRGRPTERLDRTAGLVTDAMLQAADRVEAVVDRLPPRDWWLLMELISPRIDRGGWRETVAYITGEENYNAQGAVVRGACVNLRDAYAAIERRAAA